MNHNDPRHFAQQVLNDMHALLEAEQAYLGICRTTDGDAVIDIKLSVIREIKASLYDIAYLYHLTYPPRRRGDLKLVVNKQ